MNAPTLDLWPQSERRYYAITYGPGEWLAMGAPFRTTTDPAWARMFDNKDAAAQVGAHAVEHLGPYTRITRHTNKEHTAP